MSTTDFSPDFAPWDLLLAREDEERLRKWAKARQLEVEQAKAARNKAESAAADLQARFDAMALTSPCTDPGVHAELAIKLQQAEARARAAEERLAIFERAVAGVQGAVLGIEVPRG